MRDLKYLSFFLLALSLTSLCGADETDCVNPSRECPEPPGPSEESDCCAVKVCNDPLYDDYAWYITAPETD